MDIREKSLAVLTTIIICIIAIYIILSSTLFLESYKTLESTHIQEKLDLVLKNIDTEINSLESVVKDWGPWNDTYEFIGDGNSQFIQNNLMKGTYENLYLNFIIITNTQGNILYSQGFDLKQGIFTSLRPDLIAELSDNSSPLRNLNLASRTSGFLNLPGGILVISSFPVIRNDYSGEPRGTIIMGRYLEDAKMICVPPDKHMRISIIPVAKSSLSDIDVSKFTGSRTSRVLTLAPDTQVIEGLTILNDIYGRNSIFLTVQMPRDIYNQGLHTIRLFIYLQLVVLMVLAIIMFWLLDSKVFMRLKKLSHDIVVITEGKSHGKGITDTGNDEISRLIEALNRMLDQIDKSHTALAESEKRFRELAEQFPEIMLEVDRQGTPLFINCAADAIFGYLPGELKNIGKISELFAPEERQRSLDFLSRIMKGEKISGSEFVAQKKDGNQFPVLLYAAPVISEDQVTGVRVFAADITKIKQLQEAQARAIKRIEENIHQMAVLNDQIRNPLTIIGLLCEGDGYPHNREIQAQINIITKMISAIDIGWVESLKIRQLLKNQFDIVLGKDVEDIDEIIDYQDR
jgi:PAS domain S-box-containing protein